MPRFTDRPARLVHYAADGTVTDLTPMLASDVAGAPERGVPYSVSWYVDDGAMMRADRVYVIEQLVDPLGWRLLDAISGKELRVASEGMPEFRRPTKPHPHREALAKQWGRPVSPVRVHGIQAEW